MQVIKNLQATIKQRLKKDIVFEKVTEDEYCLQTEQPDKIAFFALQAKFKVRKKGNTITLNVSRGTV